MDPKAHDWHPRYPLGHHPTVTYYQPQLEAFICEAAVVVRPDRYVAAVADTPDELSAASAALLAIIRP